MRTYLKGGTAMNVVRVLSLTGTLLSVVSGVLQSSAQEKLIKQTVSKEVANYLTKSNIVK